MNDLIEILTSDQCLAKPSVYRVSVLRLSMITPKIGLGFLATGDTSTLLPRQAVSIGFVTPSVHEDVTFAIVLSEHAITEARRLETGGVNYRLVSSRTRRRSASSCPLAMIISLPPARWTWTSILVPAGWMSSSR